MREGKRSPPPFLSRRVKKRRVRNIAKEEGLAALNKARTGRAFVIHIRRCLSRPCPLQHRPKGKPALSAHFCCPRLPLVFWCWFRQFSGGGGSVTYTCLRRLPALAGGSAVLIFFLGGEKKLRYRTTGKGWAGKGALHNFF